MFEFYGVKYIKPKVCFSTLHLVKTYQDTFFVVVVIWYIQQKFNEMSTLQSDFLFVAIHICNSFTFHDKLTLSCQYCSPRDERLRVSFFQVFIKFRVRCEFDFSFFPYLLFRMHEFKAPCMQKIIVWKTIQFLWDKPSAKN